MEKKWKSNLYEKYDMVRWMVADGWRLLAVQKLVMIEEKGSYRKKLQIYAGELILWQYLVQRHSPLSFTGGASYLLGHFSNLVWHFIPTPPISPPHISRLAPSFPLRHHHCYYNRVSLSLTHAFLFTLWHLSISFCPPSRSTCGMAVSLPYWGATVRYWTSHIPATSYWVDPTLWSQPALTRLCSAAPLELPTLRWVHVWVCENLF